MVAGACPIVDGPTHVAVVLNASSGACCFGGTPIHTDSVRQRTMVTNGGGRSVSAFGTSGEEEVRFNTWPGGVPRPLAGRVDGTTWSKFVAELSALGDNFSSGDLQTIKDAYLGQLGAKNMAVESYEFEVWQKGGSRESGGGSWAPRSLRYLRIDMPLQSQRPGGSLRAAA